MISPEELRRYPFFSFMDHAQMREMAMITEEVEAKQGEVLFQINEDAEACYLLKSGAIDFHYVVVDEHEPELRKEFMIGSVNPGEMLGISAVVEPYVYTSSAVVMADAHLLRTDAHALRELCEKDLAFAYGLQKQVAKTALERLHATRIQLAAATSPE